MTLQNKKRKEAVIFLAENFECREYAPRRIYRNAEQIRGDISEIKSKIEEVNGALSIREILFDMLSEKTERKTGEWLYDLEALLGEAESAYGKLGRLREELEYLEAELKETLCTVRF